MKKILTELFEFLDSKILEKPPTIEAIATYVYQEFGFDVKGGLQPISFIKRSDGYIETRHSSIHFDIYYDNPDDVYKNNDCIGCNLTSYHIFIGKDCNTEEIYLKKVVMEHYDDDGKNDYTKIIVSPNKPIFISDMIFNHEVEFMEFDNYKDDIIFICNACLEQLKKQNIL